jgi:hypothetical protein
VQDAVVLLYACCWFLAWQAIIFLRRKQNIPLKLKVFSELQCIINYNPVFFTKQLATSLNTWLLNPNRPRGVSHKLISRLWQLSADTEQVRGHAIGLCHKSKFRAFETRMMWKNFSVYLLFPAELGPGFHSASNSNESQKQRNDVPREQSAAGAYGWQSYHHL